MADAPGYLAAYLDTLMSGAERDETIAALAEILGFRKPHLGFVAQGELPLGFGSNLKFGNFRRRRVAKTRIRAPRLILPNLYMNSSNEAATGANATVRGAFEQNGQTVTATFSGLASGTALNGAFIVSDPVEAVDIAAGSVYWERGNGSYPGGLPYGTKNAPNINGGDCFEYGATALTDRTDAVGAFTSSDSTNSFATLGTVAMTCDPSIFHLGDSTTQGEGETAPTDDTGLTGFTKILGQFFGSFNAGIGSATAAGFIASARTNRTALANTYATHLFQGHTLNMLGDSLAKMQADLLAERNLFPNLLAYLMTTPPSGQVNDGTPANQAPGANESKRVALNDWKRLCPSAWSGCIDIADIFEVNAAGVKTRNGGRYPAGMSADMLHPTPAGYLMAKNAGGHLRSVISA